MPPSYEKPLHVVVVTPEKAVLEITAEFVVLPMFDGELGVLPGRSAFVGQLGPGEMRIKHGNETKFLYIDGGFAQVRNNSVNVLTHFARKAEEITEAGIAAEKARADAQPTTSLPERTTKAKLIHRVQGLEKVKAKIHSR